MLQILNKICSEKNSIHTHTHTQIKKNGEGWVESCALKGGNLAKKWGDKEKKVFIL